MELLLPLILLVPLLLITFRARKQQQAFAALQSRLTAGQEVVTTGGVHGRITALEDDVVLLEIADGVRVRWARAAIAQVVSDPAGQSAATVEAGADPTAQPPGTPGQPDPDGPRNP